MIVVRDHTVEIANLRPALWHALNVYDQLRQEHGVSGNTVIT